MSTALTTPTFPAVIFSVTDAGIAELEAKHKGMVVAHGDKKGYLALTQAIAEVRTARTDVEKRRKELKQDALDYGRLVDSTAKAITERLEAIEGPLKANKEQIDAENERIRKEKEEAERLRIAGIQSLIAAIANAPAALATATAGRLRQAIEKAEAMEISIADYEEFTQQATDAKTAAIEKVTGAFVTGRTALEEQRVRQSIHQYHGGRIRRYDIVESETENGLIVTRIRAEVDTDKVNTVALDQGAEIAPATVGQLNADRDENQRARKILEALDDPSQAYVVRLLNKIGRAHV